MEWCELVAGANMAAAGDRARSAFRVRKPLMLFALTVASGEGHIAPCLCNACVCVSIGRRICASSSA